MKKSDRPPMKMATRVGTLLNEVLGESGLGDKLSRYQAWLVWDQLVGEQIAQRARPLRIRQNVLEVQVDHPVWMQQLQMLKPKILEKINQQIPNAGITDIYLRKGKTIPTPAKTSQPASSQPPAWRQIELSDAEKQLIDEKLQQIDDLELRENMRRLFSLQKQLDKSRHD